MRQPCIEGCYYNPGRDGTRTGRPVPSSLTKARDINLGHIIRLAIGARARARA